MKDKTFFSFNRPFYSDYPVEICAPSKLTELFPNEKLFVLRHDNYKDYNLPLFLVDSNILQRDLEDLDSISNYEYSYIFDKSFSHCFFVHDSDNYVGSHYEAELLLYTKS